MTKREALKATINFPMPDLSIDKALIDAGIIGTDMYTVADVRLIDIAAIGLLFVLLTTGKVKEGDYSLEPADKDALTIIYSHLCAKHGLVNGLVSKPTVRGVRVW